MKNLIYIFLIIPAGVFGQVKFDFELGYPEIWKQSVPGRWDVTEENALNGSRSLQHIYDNSESGTDYIFLCMENTDSEDTLSVDFRVRHGYQPSGSNNWQLVLLTDNPYEQGLNFPLNGIIFGINYECSDDLLKIWQIAEGKRVEICVSDYNYQESVGIDSIALFRILRFPGGVWEMKIFLNEEGGFKTLAKGTEMYFQNGRYFGFQYRYSSSQDRKLWIDDVKFDGRFYEDTQPPVIIGASVYGLNRIDLVFSESVYEQNRFCFAWNGIFPDSIKVNQAKTSLYFAKNFPNRSDELLQVNGIQDQSGNILKDTIISFSRQTAEFGDIVISELLPDPEPPVYLKPCEYLELYNRFDDTIQLKDWVLMINEREYILPQQLINPGEYLIITSMDSACQGYEFPNISLFPSLTVLPNSGAKIRLFDNYRRLVHNTAYTSLSNYGDLKENGGWSIERIDLDYLCGEHLNWAFSENSSGGTPGQQNSIGETIIDNSPPVLSSLGIKDSKSIVLGFNEPLLLRGEEMASYLFQNTYLQQSCYSWPFSDDQVMLHSEDSMQAGTVYSLKVENLQDCSGNQINRIDLEFELPEIPEYRQVLINEIMYDPLPGNFEYIELYNNSVGWIDLYDLSYSVNSPGSMNAKRRTVSENSHILPPDANVILCMNKRALVSEWDLPSNYNILQLENWINLPNNGSCIQLHDRSGQLIDAICYDDSLHNDLIGITDGVSLERVSTSECKISSQCWTSASASSGYGTPGERNSQWYMEKQGSNKFRISQKVVSPDNDGHEDLIFIHLASGLENTLVDIFITTMEGFIVHDIVTNGNPGSNDIFSWDGKDSSGKVVFPGIYIIHCRVRGLSGTYVERIACAVSYR